MRNEREDEIVKRLYEGSLGGSSVLNVPVCYKIDSFIDADRFLYRWSGQQRRGRYGLFCLFYRFDGILF